MAARPDVRAAELAIEAAGARVGLATAQIWTLTAILDANGAGKEGFEMGPGIAGELPILAQNQGGRARAAAQLEASARRYTAVRAAVEEELATATTRLSRAREVLSLVAGRRGVGVRNGAATGRAVRMKPASCRCSPSSTQHDGS